MLIPALTVGLLLSGAGIGAQAVGAPPQAGLPSPAVQTAPPLAAPPAVADAETKVSDGDAVVCKYEREPNSMFSTRTCHTKNQWAEIARAARDYVNQNAGHFGCSKTSC